jgi:hypothetical protein
MNPQEQQIIESLFQRLTQGAAQAGPRDPQAEALIQERLQSFPGGPYYMAQTLILQERALQQAEARLAQQGGQGSFLPGGGQPYQSAPAPGYAPGPAYAPQPGYQQAPGGSGVGGFLAGAGKMALGIGGGILVADAAMGLAHDLFGQHDSNAALERAYQQGFEQGDRQGFEQGDRPGFEQGAYRDQTPFDGYEAPDPSFDQQDDYDTSGDSGDSGQGW